MPTIAAEDTGKLREFEQRMQQEGVAAFAAGPAPWDHWDDIGTLGTYQVWMDTVRHKTPAPEQPPRKPLTTRLLTGLAQLAVLALLIGTTGVYFSVITPDQQVASSGIQPPPIMLAGRQSLQQVTSARPVIRTYPDTLAQDGPAAEVTTPADAVDRMPLAAAAVPLPEEPQPAPSADARTDAGDRDLAMTLDELPGTAAGTMTGATRAGPEAAAASMPAINSADTPIKAPDPAADEPTQQVALHTAAIESLPGNPARKPAPAQAARDLQDTWVVNLASYNFESMAKRKLATFRDKGVNAELVHVTVKGKPMIRIRTTGYRNSREARDWVALLEERLGLQGAWIAKYQPDEK
ncbi:MAG: SPOR domain-containing protein [Gammaproteobacteria bacterium]